MPRPRAHAGDGGDHSLLRGPGRSRARGRPPSGGGCAPRPRPPAHALRSRPPRAARPPVPNAGGQALRGADRPALDLEGHRGARGLAPENTLVGFARALSIGVTTIELDLGLTRDGVAVVSHDPRLNPDLTRGPDGRWLDGPGPAIASLSYPELAVYDVGRLRPASAAAVAFPKQIPGDGARIPKLTEIFALARRAGNRDVRFNLEIKTSPLRPAETASPHAITDAVVRVVREAGLAARSTIQSFDWRVVLRVRESAADIRTACL